VVDFDDEAADFQRVYTEDNMSASNKGRGSRNAKSQPLGK